MKIHWSWKSVPELAGLTPEERKQICRKYRFKVFKERKYWIALILFMVSFGFIIGIAPNVRDKVIPDLGIWSSILFTGVPCGLIGGIFGIIQSQIQLQAMLPYIRKDLGLDNTTRE
jgi:hypothetical protein